jgi:CPA2 family monovalent cation:H+ antiporter-2
LLELGLLFVVLGVLGALARRLSLSPIPLYLLAGVGLGEGGVAPVPAAGPFVQAGATLGVVLLLLALGLEFSIPEFTHSLRRHVPSAAVDVVLCATPGAVAGLLLGFEPVAVLALAGATWISSSSIAARLLTDLRRLGNRETPSVLAVLVLEDFAMAVYLPLLAVLAAGGGPGEAATGVALAVGAVTAAFLASRRWGSAFGRLVSHPEPEQLMLRVLGVTLVVAAVAELVSASAAVGAFLVGLSLTGEAADRVRTVLTPLRDLFAAVFFVAIGLAVDPRDLLPLLPTALALAVAGLVSKLAVGAYAAARDGVGPRGRRRAGTALVARGEFSIVIIGLAAATSPDLTPLVTAYVVLLAVAGPVLARFWPRPARPGRAVRRPAVPASP